MKSRTRSILRRSIRGIEPLETRRMFSNINAFADATMDNDGVPDLIITGNAGGDDVNNVDIYIDYQNRRTIVHDDRDFIGTVNPGELYIYDTLFESINVVAKGSDDTVRVFFVTDFGCVDQIPTGSIIYSPFGGQDYGDSAMSIYADLGSGNDTFYMGTKTTGSAPNGQANLTPGASNTPQGPNVPILAGDPANNVAFDTDGADICCADLVVEVDGGTGNDKITFDLQRISLKGSDITLNADGQDGNDTINLITPSFDPHNDLSFSDAEVGIVGCDCDEISTNQADIQPDILPALIITPTNLDVNFATGGGTNTVNITTRTDIRDGSIVSIDVEGGSGADTVNDTVDVGANDNSQFLQNFNLFGGNDKVTAKYDLSNSGIVTQDDGVIHLGVTGGDGNDNIDVSNLAAPGDTSSAQLGAFDFDLKGGNGNDSVKIHLDSPVLQADVVQDWGDNGSMKAYLNGDGGNDDVEFDCQFKSNPILDVAIMGGSGDDKIVLALNDVDPNSGFRYVAPRNAILIDGGTGTDKWDFDGNGVLFTTRGVEKLDESLQPPDPTVIEV